MCCCVFVLLCPFNGHGRLWPNRLWPIVGLTDFGQTDFGQFWCFSVLAKFLNPKSPNPQDRRPTFRPPPKPEKQILTLVWLGTPPDHTPPDHRKFRSFVLSRHRFALFLSLGVFSLNSGDVFESRNPVWALGLSCEAQEARRVGPTQKSRFGQSWSKCFVQIRFGQSGNWPQSGAARKLNFLFLFTKKRMNIMKSVSEEN